MWYKIPNYTMKCRIYPNKTQHEIIDKILYGIRVAYNVTMYEMITNFKNTKEAKDKKEDKIVHFPQFSSMIKKEWLDYLRNNYPAVKEVPAGCLSSSVYGIFACDAKKAWESMGKKPVEFYKPFFYSAKKARTSYSYQETFSKFSFSEDNKNVLYINLNKLGKVKIRGWNQKIRFDEKHSKDFVDFVKESSGKTQFGLTISKNNIGEYFICFKLNNVYKFIKESDFNKEELGIDVGLKDIAICSNGDKYENKHFAKKEKRHKKILNRQCSRRWGWSNEEFRRAHKDNPEITPSKRYEKTMLSMKKLDNKIARKRDLYNHETTLKIVSSATSLAVESLNVKGMMANHRLAYALSDAAMYDVLNKLSYKSLWYNRTITAIGQFDPSSQRCSNCGYQNSLVKKLSIREWVCPCCGSHHDRDINAAKNILWYAKQKNNNTLTNK